MTGAKKSTGKKASGKSGDSKAQDAAALSGVEKLTAHQPLGLLEVQDPADLDALLLDPRLRSLILSRLAPTFALVAPGSEAGLQDALRKAGHTPRVQPRQG